MFDETTIPQQIHSASDYFQPHTQAWSLEIQKYSGFVFVTPQYNWGYPAVLKNAIDYLFNEWKGKFATVVSYGGHGGGKAAAQLKQVLNGVRMNVADTMPGLSLGKELENAAKGKKLNLTGEDAVWDGEKESILRAYKELMDLIEKGNVSGKSESE